MYDGGLTIQTEKYESSCIKINNMKLDVFLI